MRPTHPIFVRVATRSTALSGLAIVLFLLQGSPVAAMGNLKRYQYISPLPDSRLILPRNNIAIRKGGVIDESTISAALLSVVGSESGVHAGDLVLSDDSKTLVFNPDRPYTLGETIRVRLKHGIKTLQGKNLPPIKFRFFVTAADSTRQKPGSLTDLFPDMAMLSALQSQPSSSTSPQHPTAHPCESLPLDFPAISLLTSNHPDPGHVFIAPFNFNDEDTRLIILDNLGMPVFYRRIPGFGPAFDFKMQPNGLLTAYNIRRFKFAALDSSYAVVDSFVTGNGYVIDPHGLQLLPDGHVLVMSYDWQSIRMDLIVPGGYAAATVVGFIIQELDATRNVIFQWRSWDYFSITDLSSPHIALTDSFIDYVHGNAFELDQDGNILFSSRHLNEITKINRQTGDVIWRLGLNSLNNEFTFVNDTRGFSHQHDIHRLPNGNITLFDNGNHLDAPFSRALEYRLDEENKVATLVWEHRNSPDTFGPFMGNVQRRSTGGTMIGWGGTGPNPKLTDLNADGSVAFELGFPANVWSYRAFRFPWSTNRFVTDVSSLDFGPARVGDSVSLPLTVRNNSASDITINCFVSTDSAFSVKVSVPLTIPVGSSATVDVDFSPGDLGDHMANLYVRQISDVELVAQVVALRGTGSSLSPTVDLGDRQFKMFAIEPNPFRGTTVIRFELPRKSKVVLAIYDIRGRKVQTLVDGVRASGFHEETWTTKGMASGLYFSRMQVGDTVETRKLFLLE